MAESSAQHTAVVSELEDVIAGKDQLLQSLQRQVKELLLAVRGSRQERINPDQLMLFSTEELKELVEELKSELEPDDDTLPAKKRRKKKGHGRRRLPKNLQREVKRYELDDEQRACPGCGELRSECGVESSEQLEFIPARLKVIQHDRVKYSCQACGEHITTASKPPQPIEKGLPGPGLCAHTTLSKFGDHQPLYRLEDILDRTGVSIRRSTLCGWLTALAILCRPLVMRMKHLLLESEVIHTDDTKIKMLQPGMGIAKEAKFWPYLGDWLHPYAVYDFTVDRKRDGPQNFLKGYKGYLQADAYSGYDCVYAGGSVREVACWIHARRYWHKSIDAHPSEASMALGYIARLSQIEEALRTAYPKSPTGQRDFEAVARERQKLCLPILAEMESWLDELSASPRLLPKSELSKAVTYTQNQWSALVRYTEAGYLSMDNNVAERLVKVAAIGRKNYLFVGNQSGGENAAIHYSMVSSAKVNGVDPFAWLMDVYTRLPEFRSSEAFSQSAANQPVTSTELDELLPDRWLTTHPNSRWRIDQVRRLERKQARTRKQNSRRPKK